jgi:hypothetical protein
MMSVYTLRRENANRHGQRALGYRPDGRSPTALQLACALTCELKACLEAATAFKTDWKSLPPPPPLAEMLKAFEDDARQLARQASRMDEAAWERLSQFC